MCGPGKASVKPEAVHRTLVQRFGAAEVPPSPATLRPRSPAGRQPSAPVERHGLAPAARPLPYVDVDEGAPRVAAEAAHHRIAVGIVDELLLADAGDEDVGRHALHVVAVVGTPDGGVMVARPMARTDDDLPPEVRFDVPQE